MNQLRASSSPNLAYASTATEQQYDDSALEGVAANIKLLLKLIQDHKEGCDKEKNDSRRMLRVATMMTILDNVRERIQKCQSFGARRGGEAELRRCNTDLRRNMIPRDKRQGGELVVEDEKERVKRELTSSITARKSLQVMCSSLGKEKEIMASELSMKVHQMSEMEELINALKAQNNTLLQKVQECASEHKGKKSGGGGGGGESQVAAALQERNKALSEQLLKSLDGYRSMKRRFIVAQEENALMHATMDEMSGKVVTGLERVGRLREHVSSASTGDGEESPIVVLEEIEAMEGMLESFQMLVAKHDKKQGECGRINYSKPPPILT